MVGTWFQLQLRENVQHSTATHLRKEVSCKEDGVEVNLDGTDGSAYSNPYVRPYRL